MTPEEKTVRACLYGDRGPGSPATHRDLPDIFWLMGWADWEIERQFLDPEPPNGLLDFLE